MVLFPLTKMAIKIRNFFLMGLKINIRKKLIGKRNISKDFSEISAEPKKSIKDYFSNGFGEEMARINDKNKIKLPFFMIPLKGAQVNFFWGFLLNILG